MRLYLQEQVAVLNGQIILLPENGSLQLGYEHGGSGVHLVGTGADVLDCEVSHGPAGVTVRNLATQARTRLNGELIPKDQPRPFLLDDVLTIGEVGVRLMGVPFVSRSWLRWHGGLIRQMAERLDAERDFDSLPILADALEEAGCQDDVLLAACRQAGRCPLGSSILDALLERTTLALEGNGARFPRTAIISDVHSNLEALQAVLAHIDQQQVEHVFCLGDMVGYGPNPRECLDLIRSCCRVVLLGNHDQATIYLPEGYGESAERAILWTRELLQTELQGAGDRETHWSFLAQRPRWFVAGRWLFVHGSPRNPLNEYFFPEDIYNRRKMERNFTLVEGCCFAGHTHLPGVFTEDLLGDRYDFHAPEEIDQVWKLDGCKTLINVGSVGQPRDGDQRACYAILDGDTITFHHLDYDVDTTIRKIHAIPELENFLGDRLREGR